MPSVRLPARGRRGGGASPAPLIHEAAIRAGMLDLELPCGGAGHLRPVPGGGRERGGGDPVLACQTKVRRDLVVHLPENRDAAMRVVGDSHFLVTRGSAAGPRQRSRRCTGSRSITVPPASIEEHYSDWKRLVRELERVHRVCPFAPASACCANWPQRCAPRRAE